MEDGKSTVGGRRRSRGTDSSARSEALERLKAIRTRGRRSDGGLGFQIKMDEPIYDTVDEEEYDALVAKRKEEVKGFIVDDDGLGYGDLGEEEDWTKAEFFSSEEELDEENGRVKKKKMEKKEPTAGPQPKKPSSASLSLSAAAALMGKQRISSMFTTSVFKKSKDEKSRNTSSDSIVDDVIAEFAPDEADRERRRRGRMGTSSRLAPISSGLQTLKPNFDPGVSVVKPEVDVSAEIVDSSTECGANCDVADLTQTQAEVGKMSKSNNSDSYKTFEHDILDKHSVEDDRSVEVKVEVETVKDKPNGKVDIQKDRPFDEAVEDQARSEGNENGKVNAAEAKVTEVKGEPELNSDGSLPFYMVDAYEEYSGGSKSISGNLYLFGKVKVETSYQSCCVVVNNIQRCFYAIPHVSVFDSELIMKFENDVKKSVISASDLKSKLQEMSSGLKEEIRTQLVDRNVSNFSMAPVKRKYAFDSAEIPTWENYVLKVNYPFKYAALPSNLTGKTYRSLIGTNNSALENFLIKRKIKGSSWLSISKFSTCISQQRVSWCKFEVTVDCPKDIQVLKNTPPTPPLVVTAINLKTHVNEKQNINEIVSASLISCQKVKADVPTLASEWRKSGFVSHFTVVRKLDGVIFPVGFPAEVSRRNEKAQSVVLRPESSERALLQCLLNKLYHLDSDILVGHNISGFDLDVLLHRAQACKVPSSVWSKIGRLRRHTMPKLTKGNSIFGAGASLGIMACIAGRLLCDTFLCSRDLLKEVSYSLTQLAKNQLNKDRKEIAPQDIPLMFQTLESLIELVECGQVDAWLSLELMFHLSVIPLTHQLTKLSGNLWGKTLQGARAQRVEYLLLHAFHEQKFIVPDKISSHIKETKDQKLAKRRYNTGTVDQNADDIVNDAKLETDLLQHDHVKGKKGAAYAGGLVLEPKRGLYDKYILLLDFNSLYPSIIQEYNICFTTVERPPDGSIPHLPSCKEPGVLPKLLRDLVERRKTVKQMMKNAPRIKVQQHDIHQQALKLTANSMYGCLGFSNSRFYAKPLAELITLQGREILQRTVDFVQNNLNLEVIYGDTDSIMIHTGLDDIEKAKSIAAKVAQEVNKKYQCLVIDLDGLYKRMLLLKKKKYAAVKVQFRNDKPFEVIERKGLDIVRRDWSLISKEIGDFCLSQILSGGTCDDVVESIHNALVKVREKMKNGEVQLEKYVITKTLTKQPEAYPDGKNQPHVQVALRMKQNGSCTGFFPGDTVPYIICCEQGTGSTGSSGMAQRARHPDELKNSEKWMVDIDYYLSQQIHPVVSRLCASIEGTSPERLADCLGLDSTKFRSRPCDAVDMDPSTLPLGGIDDSERYKGCEPLVFSCPSCSGSFECPTIFSSFCGSTDNKTTSSTLEKPEGNFWCSLRCPKCPIEGDMGRMSSAMIANQVKRQADHFISLYYRNIMTCDEETCNYTTRALNPRVLGDSERGTVCPNYPQCNGHLLRKYTEADLYKQLSFFCHVFDTERCFQKLNMEVNAGMSLEKDLSMIRPVVQMAASTATKIRDRCAYGWINLNDFIVVV
ncbi:unnamed protein product [Rhodiola kirilowii]